MKTSRLSGLDERQRHALWAIALAFLAGVANLLGPVDILLWQLKSRVQVKPPSEEIVFVGVNQQTIRARSDLHVARLLEIIDRQNPAAVYLNIRMPDPAEDERDSVLRDTVSKFRHPIYSVATISDNHVTNDQIEENFRIVENSKALVGDIPQVYSSRYVRFFGYTQDMEYSYSVAGKEYPSLPLLLAGDVQTRGERFSIDYTFDFNRIPSYDSSELIQGDIGSLHSFDGKTVVIGATTESTGLSSIPGRIDVPPSYIYIYAAETLKAGVPIQMGWLPLVAANMLILLAGCLLRKYPKRRHLTYVLATTITVAGLTANLTHDIVLEIGPALGMLLLFGALRIWALKARFELLKDTASGLPSFVALKDDLISGEVPSTAIVVVRVAHFSDIVSVLSKDQIHLFKNHVARLISVASGNAKVYCDGKFFAFLMDSHDLQELVQHCDGLRALCDRGWNEQDTSADIVVTFGIDRNEELEIDLRLTAATAAAERARENINPIEFSTIQQKSAKSFEISIQSRIDAALRDRDIHVVYQGQLDLKDGSLVGAEALVRWNDPDRGSIPPSFFIQQCEDNGRLDALSRYVALEALSTLKESADSGVDLSMSLNVSAIQLANARIVDVLRDSIAQTGVDPARLVVEITETAKISDYGLAEYVLQTIKGMGIRTSLDDFGVGMTNLETLLRLPFDELKIDRLFVSRLKTDPKARLIVQALVNLGKESRLQVVAEGVEDAETLYTLSKLDCDLAQGYHISRPLRRDEFLEFQRFSTTRARPSKQHS